METHTIIWIVIVVISFINGYSLSSVFNESKQYRISVRISSCLVFGIFGFLVHFITYFLRLFVFLFNLIDNKIGIRFFWRLYFGDGWNMTEEQLDNFAMNAKRTIGYNKQQGNKLPSMYIKAIRIIQKKYNKGDEWSWIDNKENFIK